MADLKMPDINSITIAGNLTKDPTLRTTTNGTPVANFPIAYSRTFKDNSGNWREDVCYVGIVAWYKLAESCYENLTKGCAVMVEGELQSKSWKLENGFYRNIVEIKAKRIQFLNKKSNSEIIVEKDQTDSDHIMEEDASFAEPYSVSTPLAAGPSELNPDDEKGFDQPDGPDKPDEINKDYPGMRDLNL